MTDLEASALEQKILGGPFKDAQELINSGHAWTLEGSIGRSCMHAINIGACMLAPGSRPGYWGNTIPGRFDVKEGSKGSPEFVAERYDEVIEEFSLNQE